MSFTTTEDTDMIGKILAEYRIVEALGGQAGVQVYKAIGFNHRRPVAIKLFPPELSRDKPRLQALLDSLRKISGFDQPGIPRLIGSGLNGGRAYIITPYMTGGSLRDRLKIGPVSPADALNLLERVASALDRAHKLGVVHGHLSSAEVMFDDTGQPQIIGLGQSSNLLNGPGSNVEMTAGEHIAPEVLAGGHPTPASDQYSIAVMAFELLTGQCIEEPVEADNHGDTNSETASLPAIQLAPKVAEVLKRALQDDPSDRYPCVTAMVDDLRAALGPEVHGDRPRRSQGSGGGSSAWVVRPLEWGLISLAVVTLGCFVLSLPAMAAARWIGIDLGSVTDLFARPQPSAQATAVTEPPRIYLPGLPAALPTPTSADAQGVALPTLERMVEAHEPAQVDTPQDDGQEEPAPTQPSVANEPSADRQDLGTPVPGSAFAGDTSGPDPMETVVGSDPQGDSGQASETPAPTPANSTD